MPRFARPSVARTIGGALALFVLTGCAGAGPTPTGAPTASGTAPSAASTPGTPAAPVALRLQVSLTPQELAAFQPAIAALDAAHPEFTVTLEPVPQDGEIEKVTAGLAADDLPDVLRVQGLNVQQWIRRGAFLDLAPRVAADGPDLADFYAGPLEQFRWNGGLWGLPDSASPEIAFYNTTMFEAAGLAAPTEGWTTDDMRAAALRLTLDAAGRNAADPAFDPATIVQWGWNGGVTYFWQDALVQARGGELCANEDCTTMDFTSPPTRAALDWWTSLVRDDHAALFDPYGGSQTGVPGDPFIAGKAAMGSNGTFAIGQLNDAGTIAYDVIPPLIGTDGRRHTPLSTNGYVINAASQHPDEAWALVRALVEPDFLALVWGRPGNGVPARISAAHSAIDASHPPIHQEAILAAMEVGRVFRPYTASAFAAYGATVDLFTKLNTGAIGLDDGLAQLEQAANDALAPDRTP